MFFKDKRIWITGASSGIGKALAIEFAKNGGNVIISSNDITELKATKRDIDKLNVECDIFDFDLSNPEDVSNTADKIIDRYKKIDILINNGGISQRAKVGETSIDIDRKIMEINFFSGVIITKKILPIMLKNGGGHILATSSISGKFGFHLRSAYAASKHAVYGFYESLRAEYLRKGINVTIITPGRVKTNISFNALEANGDIHGKMDNGQNNGVTPEYAAKKVLSAIKKNKAEILIGKKELLMVHIKRFFPKLFYKLVYRREKKNVR